MPLLTKLPKSRACYQEPRVGTPLPWSDELREQLKKPEPPPPPAPTKKGSTKKKGKAKKVEAPPPPPPVQGARPTFTYTEEITPPVEDLKTRPAMLALRQRCVARARTPWTRARSPHTPSCHALLCPPAVPQGERSDGVRRQVRS